MNALDFLFDFAALMSTSSAMTQSPGAGKAPNLSVHQIHPSKASSSLGSHIPEGRLQPSRHRLQSQPTRSIPSLPQEGNNMTTFSRTNADDVNNVPIEWIPTLPRSQNVPSTQHTSLLPNYSQLDHLSTLDCDLPCGQNPNQHCYCRHISPLVLSTSHDWVPPYVHDQSFMQFPQHFQQIQEEEVPCGYICDEPQSGQPCTGRYLPTQPYSIVESDMHIFSQPMWDIDQGDLDVHAYDHTNRHTIEGNMF